MRQAVEREVELLEADEMLDVGVHRGQLVVRDREREQPALLPDAARELLQHVVAEVDGGDVGVDARFDGVRLERERGEAERVGRHARVEPLQVVHHLPETLGADLGRRRPQRVVVEAEGGEGSDLAELRRKRQQLVARHVELAERREIANRVGEELELVARGGEVCQRRERADPRRDLAQIVLVQVEHRQPPQLRELHGEAAQVIRAHRKLLEVDERLADARVELGQPVVGQRQDRDVARVEDVLVQLVEVA
eukprot:3077384-Rhodomonas_salina.1